ncbi:MAG: DUF1360 domain-containing protein [bacterium]
MRNAEQIFNSPSEEITFSGKKQSLFNILFIGLYITIIVLISKEIHFNNYINNKFGIINIIILLLAIFRITKLFLSDHIMQWFRDIFFIVVFEKINNQIKITRSFPKNGLQREIALLLDCPWCLSLWVSLFVIYFWIKYPITILFFYITAFSGMSTLLYLGIKKS